MEQVINPVKRVNQKPDSRIKVMDAFDKTNWTRLTFGEVCRNINITEKDPIAKGIERYVGLEHIEPNSLHIKSWGNVADGTTFTKKFSAGHVLFGKRRAYLRKAAIADFDGLCSGDILVFEANEDVIDPNLFPFLVQSDRFFDFAIQTSAGSLSPRTKFQDLAKFEFLLPPKEQQAKLAELLWAADDVVETKKQLLEYLEQTLRTTRDLAASGLLKRNSRLCYNDEIKANVLEGLTVKRLGSVISDIRYGTSMKSNSSSGIPILRIPNVVKEEINLDDIAFVELADREIENTKLCEGDILIVRTNGNPSYVGRSALFNLKGDYAFASYLIKVTINRDNVNPHFLINYLQSGFIRDYFRRNARSSAGNYNINTQTIKQVPFLQHELSYQDYCIEAVKDIKSSIKQSSNLLDKEAILLNELINLIFL